MIALRVDNLSKSYRIAHQANGAAGRYRTLREDLADIPKRLLARLGSASGANSSHGSSEEFHALRDISFEVRQGEVLGVIGRNGAGKSTLLKILSRITEPTSGRVEVFGRVASLLEVGTGFHPELTGRENIFLNGAILGMRRAEIARKFDEIVDFAEVEKFLDTPVKRYSSGMYVRLAFAVAAHLDPEILIVDEVLAVGDGEFQKKCLGKMQNISEQEGRTVLFVSHQLGAVLQLCTKGLVLTNGSISFAGDAKSAVDAYTKGNALETSGKYIPTAIAEGKDIAIAGVETRNVDGVPTHRFTQDEDITVAITCKIQRWVSGAEARIHVKDASLRPVFTSDTPIEKSAGATEGILEAAATIPAPFLRPGTFIFTIAVFIPNILILDVAHDAFTITVLDSGSSLVGEGAYYGCVFAPCQWKLKWRSERDPAQPALSTSA